MWIVFIVSCVPTVRPIFVKVIGKVYSNSQSRSRTFPSRNLYAKQTSSNGAGTHSLAYASKKDASANVDPMPEDNESEQHILPGEPGGILMTSQIVVRYDEGEDDRKERSERRKNEFDDVG
jgi:hypothetical protein